MLEQHNKEIYLNLEYWKNKKILRDIYKQFYTLINSYVDRNIPGNIVEFGSGIAKIKEVILDCICTDIFPNPWIDRTESVYLTSFESNSVSNIIIFDVFHHIEFPANALQEFKRILVKNGRVIIFDPCISLMGMVVFGLFHHEPLGLFKKTNTSVVSNTTVEGSGYFAAQGNAFRIFNNANNYPELLSGWEIISLEKFSAISYVASGGYSKPRLFPDFFYGLMKKIDKFCDYFPPLFATRLLIVLKKN